MKNVYTKTQFIRIFKELGIKEAMTVCLQVDTRSIPSVLSGAQTIIEAVMEVVTKKGCIIVPVFDGSCLDPACRNEFDYEKWEEIRKEMLGYKANLNATDAFGQQFLRNEGVVRSRHPVYSFAYWGSFRSAWLDENSDYPISFDRSLYPMVHRDAVNIVIGMDPKDSVLLPAVAKEKKEGTLFVQRAKVRRGKTSIFKTFLNLKLSDSARQRCLKECHEKNYKWDHGYIYCLWLDTRTDKTEATSSSVSLMSMVK